jgi:threonine dehydrogenase-like Zn-dependent dehydrogenase
VALQLLAADPERFRRLITHRFPLAEITRAFETAGDKRCGSIKVAIQP